MKWILIFWGVLFSGSVLAQKTIVSGHIYDADTKEALPFVSLSFKNSKIGTSSDLSGAYRIETYYAEDSLIANFMGYKPLVLPVNQDHTQTIDFFLEPGKVSLNQVVINAKDTENPAHTILKKIIKNKPVNNRKKLDSYQYEVYNKIEFDLNNISKKFTERKVFKDFDFIFKQLDSSRAKVALPFFITETLSDYYYQRDPKGQKEIIHATKVSGINNESISQFLGQMYMDVNIYNNSIGIFGKNFISPIADYGLLFYEYTLVDSMFIDSKWCYRINFDPKNDAELVFEGHFWVNDTTYAIKQIDAHILKTANINFITDLDVHHTYQEVEDEVWMLTKEKIVADFTIIEGEMGFYGKKSTSYRDFVINKPKEDSFYGGAEPVITMSPINSKSIEYWQAARHEDITENQQAIYKMVDRLKSNPRFMTYVDIVNFLFQGYTVQGPIEIGPVFTFLSYNSVEGFRPKFGLRTSNAFSTDLMLEGYVAYGTRDKRFKFMLGGQYFLSKNPRQSVGAYYSEDLELIGQIPNYFPRDHFVQFLTLRNPQDQLILNKEARIYTQREWFTGFSTLLEFRRRDLAARGAWEFERKISEGDNAKVVGINSIVSSEISVGVRFAYRESFVTGEFERVSLGSIWPIIQVRADIGMKGILGSDYTYQKLTGNVFDKLPLGPFGTMEYTLEAGKTWEAVPYPLGFVHAGNESFLQNSNSFNTMNYFEFVSDRYVSLRLEHHFEGFFFNKIPLLRRLKLRELIGINAVYGGFDPANLTKMLLPDRSYAFDDRPFAEAYVGIENIFKLIRIDAIWRLSYLDHPFAQKFGVLIGFDIQF